MWEINNVYSLRNFSEVCHAFCCYFFFAFNIHTLCHCYSSFKKQVSSPHANQKRKPNCDAGNETLSRRRIIENIRTVLQRGGSDRWIRWVRRREKRRGELSATRLCSQAARSPRGIQVYSQLHRQLLNIHPNYIPKLMHNCHEIYAGAFIYTQKRMRIPLHSRPVKQSWLTYFKRTELYKNLLFKAYFTSS